MTETTIRELEGLQRFLLRGGQGPAAQMVEDIHGAWVRYGDVQARDRQRRAQLLEERDARRRWRRRSLKLREEVEYERSRAEQLERQVQELRSSGERCSSGVALAPDRIFRRDDAAPVCSPFRSAETAGELLEAEPPHDAELAAFGDLAEQVLLAGAGRARFERTATAGEGTVTDALELEVDAPAVKAPAELEGRVEERLRALGAPLGDATREELLGLRAEHERIVPMLGAARELEGRADEGGVADRVEALIFERVELGGGQVGRTTWRQAAKLARKLRADGESDLARMGAELRAARDDADVLGILDDLLSQAEELDLGEADEGKLTDRAEELIFEKLDPVDGVLGGRRTWRTAAEQARERRDELERELEVSRAARRAVEEERDVMRERGDRLDASLDEARKRIRELRSAGAARSSGAGLERRLEAVLHQLEHGEASDGDERDLVWCARELRALLYELPELTSGLAGRLVPDEVRMAAERTILDSAPGRDWHGPSLRMMADWIRREAAAARIDLERSAPAERCSGGAKVDPAERLDPAVAAAIAEIDRVGVELVRGDGIPSDYAEDHHGSATQRAALATAGGQAREFARRAGGRLAQQTRVLRETLERCSRRAKVDAPAPGSGWIATGCAECGNGAVAYCAECDAVLQDEAGESIAFGDPDDARAGRPARAKRDPLCRLCNGSGVIEQGPVDGRCATCNGTGVREERASSAEPRLRETALEERPEVRP